MKKRIKILLFSSIFLSLLVIGKTVLSYYGSLEYPPINQLIHESDVVVIGTVTDHSNDILRRYQVGTNTESTYYMDPTYTLGTVEISEVLKYNLTEESIMKDLKTIFVFEKEPIGDISAVLSNQKKYLLFLKSAVIPGTILHELKIAPSQSYSVTYGWKGVIFISHPLRERNKILETQYGIYNVNDYVNAVRDFCKVMRLEKDKEKYEEGLLQLLKKGGKIYEESAAAELEKIGIKIKNVQGR